MNEQVDGRGPNRYSVEWDLYLGSEEASHSWEAHLARVTLWGEQDEMV